MGNSSVSWICCQLGAREHYSVPRALQRTNVLFELITDFWVAPGNPACLIFPHKLRERFHPELVDATINSPNLSAILFEGRHVILGRKGWELIMRRNDWFQEQAIQELMRLEQRYPRRKFCLFSFSYTARRIFDFAKSKGWTTVLGQIDPGPAEERIVAHLHQEHAALAGSWMAAPLRYWHGWREECRLADKVIVNSEWSRQSMLEEGVSNEKISVVPLAYEAPVDAADFQKIFPDAFTFERPLRVLFLGQIILRKGIAPILDAMLLLRNSPVEFLFVGPRQMPIPKDYFNNKNARWIGAVPRSEAARYYREADVFLFPTYSDGFGLTQLEAQAWKLPIIASQFCGDVVRDGINGIILKSVSGKAITEVIFSLMDNPGRLKIMSRHAIARTDFGIDQLGSNLLQVVA